MLEFHGAIAAVLMDIEKELRELRLWETEMLPPEALLSVQPFAVDTMTFPQWLQFIFLPRLYFLLEQQLDLPHGSAISPMAEYYFSALNLPSSPLINHLKTIDALLSGEHGSNHP